MLSSDIADFYRDMLMQAADGVVIINGLNQIVFFNTAAEKLWGCPASEVMGKNVNCLVPIELRAPHDGYVNENRRTGVNHIVGTSREVVFNRSNGDYVAAEMSVSTAIIGSDNERYYMAFLKGVTEESHRKKILALQENVFNKISSDNSEQDIAEVLCAEMEQMVPNCVATLIQVNSERNLEILAGEGLSRRKIAMLLRISITDADISAMIKTPESARSIVWKNETFPSQETEFLDCWASAIFNGAGELIGICALYSRNRDKITNWPQKVVTACVPSGAAIIERGRTRQKIDRLDRFDSLTGLFNRFAMTDIMQKMSSSQTNSSFALLVLDVDHFQDINNLLGYDNGDLLLKIIGRKITSQCRSNFIVGRIGGDNFLVIIPDADQETVTTFVDKMTATMNDAIVIQQQEFVVSLSIGISIYPDDGVFIEQILNRAELAVRQAKNTTRKSFRIQGGIANDDLKARVIIGSELRKAIQNSELELFYQPQISTNTGALYGAEALSRWNHATLGPIPPSCFIPVAEATGQIEAIGLWSLEEAWRQIARWDRQALHVPIVSVNLSALQLKNRHFPEQIATLLARYEVSSSRLTVEITESIAMQETDDSAYVIACLREIGVGLSLDDFGTGFSSLSRISHLPVTEIKVDRSFVLNIGTDVSSVIVTEAAINIGKRLGLSVVVEGVEDQLQEFRLREIGCDVMQGYLFARPMPSGDFETWQRSRMRKANGD